jgi:anti-sigma B factor antagonist
MSNPCAFSVDGELTIYRAAELRAALQAALAGVVDGDELQVDLSGVTEMDCAGVQLLMAARKTARAAGRDVRISQRSSVVTEVFETLQLATYFDDTPSPSAAIHS